MGSGTVAEARERATDYAMDALKLDRDSASKLVTLLIAAAAEESTARVLDSVVQGLQIINDKSHKAADAVIARMARELGGEWGDDA